jgi:hypothetical protein
MIPNIARRGDLEMVKMKLIPPREGSITRHKKEI